MSVEEPEVAGAASVEPQIVPFQIGIHMQDSRPEYEDRAKRVGDHLMRVMQGDPELYRAFAYLVNDTPFAVVVAPRAKSHIIIPKMRVAP